MFVNALQFQEEEEEMCEAEHLQMRKVLHQLVVFIMFSDSCYIVFHQRRGC